MPFLPRVMAGRLSKAKGSYPPSRFFAAANPPSCRTYFSWICNEPLLEKAINGTASGIFFCGS
jgi:hypothetical protein